MSYVQKCTGGIIFIIYQQKHKFSELFSYTKSPFKFCSHSCVRLLFFLKPSGFTFSADVLVLAVLCPQQALAMCVMDWESHFRSVMLAVEVYWLPWQQVCSSWSISITETISNRTLEVVPQLHASNCIFHIIGQSSSHCGHTSTLCCFFCDWKRQIRVLTCGLHSKTWLT